LFTSKTKLNLNKSVSNSTIVFLASKQQLLTLCKQLPFTGKQVKWHASQKY